MTNTPAVRPVIGRLVAIVTALVVSCVAFTIIQNKNMGVLPSKVKVAKELASLPIPLGDEKVGGEAIADRVNFFTVTQKFATSKVSEDVRSAYSGIFKSRGWRPIPSVAGDDELRYCKSESILVSLIMDGKSKDGTSAYKIIITVGGSAIFSCA